MQASTNTSTLSSGECPALQSRGIGFINNPESTLPLSLRCYQWLYKNRVIEGLNPAPQETHCLHQPSELVTQLVRWFLDPLEPAYRMIGWNAMKGSALALESIHHHEHRDPEAGPMIREMVTTGGGAPLGAAEVRAAVTAAAEVARLNQNISTAQTDSRGASGYANPETESGFATEVCDISNTYTNICSVCFNVDVTTGPTQLEEANLTYMSKVQAIQNLH